jgi:hypothetical protein
MAPARRSLPALTSLLVHAQPHHAAYEIQRKSYSAGAYRVLFEMSGETPRWAYFDQPLVRTLNALLPELSRAGRNNVEWLLRSIEALGIEL